MDLARRLAERGRYTVAPNPLVGAVVARDGTAIGECWHARTGGDHAEIGALREAGEAARGATMYTTLEPCNHYGRTPPCTEAILKAGIARIVIGHLDPNPKMRGKSVEILEDAGVEGLRRIKANTVEKRLLNARGEPNFNIRFFALNKKGEYAGVSMYAWGETKFALCTERGAESPSLEPLLPGAPTD